jgi:hypothetical protein
MTRHWEKASGKSPDLHSAPSRLRAAYYNEKSQSQGDYYASLEQSEKHADKISEQRFCQLGRRASDEL